MPNSLLANADINNTIAPKAKATGNQGILANNGFDKNKRKLIKASSAMLNPLGGKYCNPI